MGFPSAMFANGFKNKSTKLVLVGVSVYFFIIMKQEDQWSC